MSNIVNLIQSVEEQRNKWTGVAFINRVVDKILKNIKPLLAFTACKLPDCSHKHKQSIVCGIFQINIPIKLTEGSHTVEPIIKRNPTKATEVAYDNQGVVFKLSLEIHNFKIAYDISIESYFCNLKEVVLGKLDGAKVTIEISIDEMLHIDVKSLKIHDIGKIDVQWIDGRFIKNFVSNAQVSEIYKQITDVQIKQAEEAILLEIRTKLQKMNAMFI